MRMLRFVYKGRLACAVLRASRHGWQNTARALAFDACEDDLFVVWLAY